MKATVVEEAVTAEDQVEKDLAEVEERLAEIAGPVQVEPLVLMVRRQYTEEGELIGAPDEETEELALQDFAVEPARTGLSLSQTLNMGQYWSAQVRVSLTVPCHREEAVPAFEFAAKFVTERLAVETEKARKRIEELRGDRVADEDDHPF